MAPMKILLNGEPRDVDEGLSLGALLDATPYGQRRIAVEINREIVPKSRRGEHILREGDQIEIVQAMGGG
jgi:sulfur carrier protein